MYCQKIPVTEFEIDPDHPHLLAVGKTFYGVFQVTYEKVFKYAIVKIN